METQLSQFLQSKICITCGSSLFEDDHRLLLGEHKVLCFPKLQKIEWQENSYLVHSLNAFFLGILTTAHLMEALEQTSLHELQQLKNYSPFVTLEWAKRVFKTENQEIDYIIFENIIGEEGERIFIVCIKLENTKFYLDLTHDIFISPEDLVRKIKLHYILPSCIDSYRRVAKKAGAPLEGELFLNGLIEYVSTRTYLEGFKYQDADWWKAQLQRFL